MCDSLGDRAAFLNKCKRFIMEINKAYPISFGYLFGSRARGTYNDMSDVDFALKFEKKYEDREEAFIRGDIIESAKESFKEPVDIVNLENAPITLRYLVVQEGIVIKDTEDGCRASFESITLREYFDFEYYSERYNDAVIKRIKEGNYFGG